MAAEVLCHRRASLGESPRWDGRAGLVRWLDIDAGIVLSVPLSGGPESELSVGAPCGALVLHEDGGIVVSRGDAWLRPGTRRSAGIGRPTMRFNDAGVDSTGTIWSATMRSDEVLTPPAQGALYRVSSPIEESIPGLIAGNGIAWSPDERVMYVVDSGTNTVMRVPFDAGSPELGNPEPWLTLSEGIADGIAVDIEGGVWVAQWGTGSVRRYADDGRLTYVLSVPTAQVTALSFAGGSLNHLVITSASMGTEIAQDPLAGALFVAEAPVAGLPLHRAVW